MLANIIIGDDDNIQHEYLFSAWRPFWAPAADEEEEETVRSVGTWRYLYLQIFLIFLIFFNVFLLIFFNIFKISRHLKRLMFANILSIADIFQYFLKCIILSDCVGRTWSQWKNLGKFFYSAYSSSFSFQHLYHRCCNGYDDDDHNQSQNHHYIHRFSHRWASVRFVRGWSTLGRGHFTIFTANMF